MKVRTTTFLEHKIYLFSFIAFLLVNILSSLPAFSQVDYYFGLNRKGIRLGVGAGAAVLQSNWSSQGVNPAGVLTLDYDLNQYFSIGLTQEFGMLSGVDAENKLYFQKTSVIFGSTSVGFKVAVGQFSDFTTSSSVVEALKRIYIGVGVGGVYSNVTLTPHTDGKGLSSLTTTTATGEIVTTGKKTPGTIQTSKGTFTSTATYMQIPINFGTNIALRGFLGNDKVELNPNLQYTLVKSPYFDGYQPNSEASAGNPKVNGNQAYFVGSLSLRFKF